MISGTSPSSSFRVRREASASHGIAQENMGAFGKTPA
jgi:hypothetical protein